MIDRGFLKGLAVGTFVMCANMQAFVLERAELSISQASTVSAFDDQPNTPKLRASNTPQIRTSTQNLMTTEEETPKIPHRIIVAHKHKTLEDIPEPRLSNVKNTIQQCESLWNEMEVWYLNDDDCQVVLEQVDMRLLKHFWFETRGMHRSDLCRHAALCLKGGCCFDNDMQVVQPVKVAPHATFVSPFEWGCNLKGEPRGLGLFNSFMATSPKHPILKKTFDLAVEHYDKGRRFGSHMGTGALFQACASLSMEDKGMVDVALSETKLTKFMCPDFPRLDGQGCCCDVIVHNAADQQVCFYSHMVGDKGKITCGAK